METFKYTIIRRPSSKPKRRRESHPITQSDLDALRNEITGSSAITDAMKEVDDSLTGISSSKQDKPAEGTSFVLNTELPDSIVATVKGDSALQELIRGQKGEKGDTPKLSLDNQYRLVADGTLVSQRSLKGRDGVDGVNGKNGKDGINGHSPVVEVRPDKYIYVDGKRQQYLKGDKGDKPTVRWDGTKLLVDNLQAVDLKGEKGDKGDKPSTSEIVSSSEMSAAIRDSTSQAVTDLSKTIKQDIKKLEERQDNQYTVQHYKRGDVRRGQIVSNHIVAGSTVVHHFVQLTDGKGRDVTVVDSYRVRWVVNRGRTRKPLERIVVGAYCDVTDKDIMPASQGTPATYSIDVETRFDGTWKAVSRETYYDIDPGDDRVTKANEGRGHIGDIHFQKGRVDFRKNELAQPHLSILEDDFEDLSDLLSEASQTSTPVNVSSLTLTEQQRQRSWSLDVRNDNTKVDIYISTLEVACYTPSMLQLEVDGVNLDTWQGRMVANNHGSQDPSTWTFDDVPYKGSNKHYQRILSKGRHTVTLSISSDGTATLKGVKVVQRYDKDVTQSLIAPNGLRFFGSANRYFNVDDRQVYFNDKNIPVLNPYTLRVKGGMQLDELDMPGVPICGATFNEHGTELKSFGRYAKRKGNEHAQAVYDRQAQCFKVYHSIGHTNYIPMVQVSGWADDNIKWSLTPRVYGVASDYFTLRILTNGDNPRAFGFSYVAFKTYG